MLLRPRQEDVRVIVRTVGLSLLAFGVPVGALATGSLLAGDVDSGTALVVGAAAAVILGSSLRLAAWSRRRPSWTTSVVAATISWVACSVVGSLPLYLSGNYGNLLDAVFEAMSGLTTTGLTLVQDLDHLPAAIALYRHLLELFGGLAIVVVGLTVLTAATATESSLAPSDVRDERILPSPGRTWRQVASVASVVVGTGVVLCTVAVAVAGVQGWRALLHGVSLAVAASTTGGFSVSSVSVAAYHSATVQLVLVPLMLAGAISFSLHIAAAQGRRWTLLREFEVRVMLASLVALLAAVMVGLARAGAHTDILPLLRAGAFTTIAAHTTTGLHVVAPRLVATDWGQLAPAALVAAMTVGGMTGSTAGGLKALRVGVIGKGMVADVRRVLLPESSLVVSTFRWGRVRPLRHAHVRSAATMLLITLTAILTAAVVVLYVDGTVDLTEALFAATSAATNSGQSLGTVTPDSPSSMKAGFLTLMLLGRLEWMAVFATFGFAMAGLRGRR